MINDFVTFRQADELYKLGFNYRCFASYSPKSKTISIAMDGHEDRIPAPTYAYAFDWSRDNGLFPNIDTFFNGDMMYGFSIMQFDDEGNMQKESTLCQYVSHREAQSECLDKIIEMFKQIK